MAQLDGLIGAPKTKNSVGRDRWWGAPGHTLQSIIDGIRREDTPLEMPLSPPPSPLARRWHPPLTARWLLRGHSVIVVASILPLVFFRSAVSSVAFLVPCFLVLKHVVPRPQDRGEGGGHHAAEEVQSGARDHHLRARAAVATASWQPDRDSETPAGGLARGGVPPAVGGVPDQRPRGSLPPCAAGVHRGPQRLGGPALHHNRVVDPRHRRPHCGPDGWRWQHR